MQTIIPTKITFIGAGSYVFTRELVKDILSVPDLQNVEFVFMDIDGNNLTILSQLIERDLEANGREFVKTRFTLDRREALKDAKYVFNVVKIGGIEAFQHDVEIPLKYGVSQCVGDTLCAGGIMYGQRNIPYLLELCKEMHELSRPDVLLLNYANPMAMNTWVAQIYGGIRTIGLCHGIQHGHALIADVLGIAKEEINITCIGINHLAWYTKVMHQGVDLTGKLLHAFESNPRVMKEEKVRIDILRRFGYFCTESNGHLSEYLPWYRKRPDELDRWIDLSNWINGETGGYLRLCKERANAKKDYEAFIKASNPLVYGKRSVEHGSYIIEAIETGRIYRGHFNVVNNGAIGNLPHDAVVEVPCYVDSNGISAAYTGNLPIALAAVCHTNINVQRLAVEAGTTGDDRLLRQAILLDPLVGAVCNTQEVWDMADELLLAEKEFLPQYADAIKEIEIRKNGGTTK